MLAPRPLSYGHTSFRRRILEIVADLSQCLFAHRVMLLAIEDSHSAGQL